MSDKVNFAWPVSSEHSIVLQHFTSKTESIMDKLAGRRIIIFGAGIRGCTLASILEQRGQRDILFCDNNPEKQGNRINEHDIVSLNETLSFGNSRIYLVSPENSNSMCQQLEHIGLVESKDYFSFDVSAYDIYVSEYLRQLSNHILIIGDCAFTHIAFIDKCLDSLGDMLKSHYGSNHCKVLGMHGMGWRAYYHIVKSMLARGEKPVQLVVLLALEALTSKAHLMPRTQHSQLIQKLAAAIGNADSELSEYAQLTEERFNRFQIESFASANSAKNEPSEKLFMKMNYLFSIKDTSEGVIYLIKTVKLMNECNVPIVFYIPPVNYMQGEKYFGDEFNRKYKENFEKLFSFLNRELLEYHVADASHLLDSNEFAATNTIDETSNYSGRRKQVRFLTEHEEIRSALAI